MSEISWFQCYSWFPLSGKLFSHSSLCVYCTNTWTRVQLHAADRLNNTLNLLSKFNMHVTYQFEMENLVVSASNEDVTCQSSYTSGAQRHLRGN